MSRSDWGKIGKIGRGLKRFIPAYWQCRINRLKKAGASSGVEQNNPKCKNNPSAEYDAKIGEIVAALHDIRDANKVDTAKQQAEWERNDVREAGRSRLEIAAIIVAGLGAVILWRQQNTMQDTLDEMRIEQRAWMTVSDIKFLKSPDLDRGKFDFNILVKNIGRSPASVLVREKVFHGQHAGKWANLAADFCGKQKALVKDGVFPYGIVPGDEFPFFINTDGTNGFAENGPYRGEQPFIIGCVFYWPDSKIHVTSFVATISVCSVASARVHLKSDEAHDIPPSGNTGLCIHSLTISGDST